MKSITRLSLALIMFSLLSISYLVTSAIAQTSTAPTGTGMPPTGMAPTDTPESGGISGWIKGGLQALGIGSAPEMEEPVMNPAGMPGKGAPGAVGLPGSAANAAAARAIDDAVLSPAAARMQKCIDDMSKNEPGRDAKEYCGIDR
jgi:hypothetical protein